MLPQYIPLHVAESILFVGKAVRVLRNPSKSFKSHVGSHDQQYMKQETMSQKVLFPNSELKDSFSELQDNQGSELLPQSELEKIASLIETVKVDCSTFVYILGSCFCSLSIFFYTALCKNVLRS
jgi:gamma-tubulin complex component 4